MIVKLLTYSTVDPDPNDDCYGTANINLVNGKVFICNNQTRRYELDAQLAMLPASAIGSETGKVPTLPILMSQMSAPVKSTIDGITAVGGDSAAYYPASAFAPKTSTSNVVNVRTRKFQYAKSLVSFNSLNTDVAAITGLPSYLTHSGLLAPVRHCLPWRRWHCTVVQAGQERR